MTVGEVHGSSGVLGHHGRQIDKAPSHPEVGDIHGPDQVEVKT